MAWSCPYCGEPCHLDPISFVMDHEDLPHTCPPEKVNDRQYLEGDFVYWPNVQPLAANQ